VRTRIPARRERQTYRAQEEERSERDQQNQGKAGDRQMLHGSGLRDDEEDEKR